MTDASKSVINFPIVGIGASAGGLEAATVLLKNLPLNTGMAYILVQHLSPTHPSMLAELLGRETKLPVIEIVDGMSVKADHVYVIPPNTNLGILHGVLHLMLRSEQPGQHLPIDFFLRSLATEMTNRAVGVILSGSASDGVLGLMEIKAAGGITFAQDESTAAYASMPHSAIAAGCVDFVLPPDKIASELVRIAQHPYLSHVSVKSEKPLPSEEDHLRKIFLLLRQHSGNDFTYYKQSTILRRIKRRILLHKFERLEDYLRYLQSTPLEVENLFRDLLINVTSFFRDPEIFEELKSNIFPTLIKNRENNSPIRIWVPGCSTGEEVYSIAICLYEFLGDMASNTAIKFFATDLDEEAVEKSRRGIYAHTISEVVSNSRLQRFFTKVEEGYQISKHIRDVCIFAQQNVIKDPPFSKLDMISCRNLLIYLSPVLQKKLIPVFHYALKNKGVLLLGTSETIGRHADLFRLIDKRHKFYEKKSIVGPVYVNIAENSLFDMKVTDNKNNMPTQDESWTNLDIQREADRVVLKKYAPCGVVINHQMDVIQFRGRTGKFLEPAVGEASLNLLKMARNGLHLDLRNAINEAIKKKISIEKTGLRVESNGDVKCVTIEVDPLLDKDNSSDYLLVSFRDDTEISKLDQTDKIKIPLTNQNHEIQRINQELSSTREYLHSVIEQQDVTNEELTSANEEIQASNEELQSTNEELETAKEELQSSNEELSTVNDEMNNRNMELEVLNNDLFNLIEGLSIPVVMVDEALCIRRFSHKAEELLNLIITDRGRPIGQIKSTIELPDIEIKILEVIDSVQSLELEVQNSEGVWYKVGIHPYKTLDNKVSGAVIAFFDIHDMKKSLIMAENAQHYAEAIIAAIRHPMLVLDKNLRVVSASQKYYSIFHVNEKDTVGNLLYRLGNGQWGIPSLRQKLEEVVTKNVNFNDYEVEHDFEHIGHKAMSVSGQSVAYGLDKETMILMQIENIGD
ncbi:MAG: PAS domain-containing protein [Gammaproteobacteria bacterium]|nr:PAS domain-containing protein [Gammaproteobacteria bacterium]